MDQLQVCCCAAAYALSTSTEDGVWRIKILVCWLSSYPDPLLRFYLRSSIFNVVVPKEYQCKCGSISNYNRWLSKGLYYDEVRIISVQLWASVLSSLSCLQSDDMTPSSGDVVIYTFLSQQRTCKAGGTWCCLRSMYMATLSSSYFKKA